MFDRHHFMMRRLLSLLYSRLDFVRPNIMYTVSSHTHTHLYREIFNGCVKAENEESKRAQLEVGVCHWAETQRD